MRWETDQTKETAPNGAMNGDHMEKYLWKKFYRKTTGILTTLLLAAGLFLLPASAAEHHDYTAAELLEVIDGIMQWEEGQGRPNERSGIFHSDFLKNVDTSMGDWMAFAAGRSGSFTGGKIYAAVLKQDIAKKYEKEKKLEKATEWQRTALALLALGEDPTKLESLDGDAAIDLIADGTYDRGKTEPLDTQGSNGVIWGLLALDAMHYQVPEGAADDRESIVASILEAQQEDGGFSLTKDATGKSNVDITAMALTALAPYRNRSEEVQGAVEAAVNYLSEKQQEDGGFGSELDMGGEDEMGGCSESCAQVLTALCTLGIDAGKDGRFIKNGCTVMDALMAYRQEDGGFIHSLAFDEDNPSAKPGESNLLATGQAAYALTALCRYYGNMRNLFDLRPEPGEEVRAQITDLEERIAGITEETPKEELEELLEAYGEIPKEENSYVNHFPELARAAEDAGITVKRDALTAGMEQNTEGNGSLTALDGREISAELTFSEEDVKAVEALPERMTTEYESQVAGLLAKLKESANYADHAELAPVLQEKQKEIGAIREEISELDALILEKLYPIEALEAGDREMVEEIDSRIRALDPYDQKQVSAYEDVKRAVTMVSNSRTERFVKLGAVLGAVILLGILLLRAAGRRKKKKMDMQEDADDFDEE